MALLTRAYLLNLKGEKEEAERKKREAEESEAKKRHIVRAMEQIKQAIVTQATAGVTNIRFHRFSKHSPLALDFTRYGIIPKYKIFEMPNSNTHYTLDVYDCSEVISELVIHDLILAIKELCPDSLVSSVECEHAGYVQKDIMVDWS